MAMKQWGHSFVVWRGFVYSRPEQLLEHYDLKIKTISKGRECYLCDTSLGAKALCEYRGSKERAGFLAEMLDYLRESRFLVPVVTRTKEGEVLVIDEDECKYILADAFHGAECDTKNRDDMLIAVKQLASLHNTARGFSGAIPEFVGIDRNSLLVSYEKHNRELRQVRNYIRNRKKKNAFEELFMKQYEPFQKKATEVTDALRAMEPKKELFGFCHGDFNQHNVIFSRQGIAIVGLDRFSYDIQIGDLANFVRKMLEKNNWNTGLGLDMIQAYDSVRKIEEQEYRYLYFYLAYPGKFYKIANHYNNSHKAWLSGRDIEKLEKVFTQEEAREQFLKILFHFVK